MGIIHCNTQDNIDRGPFFHHTVKVLYQLHQPLIKRVMFFISSMRNMVALLWQVDCVHAHVQTGVHMSDEVRNLPSGKQV